MKKAGNTIRKFKGNNKGYTLIELIVVVAMIVALTTLGTGGFVALSHARANKASNSLDSLIAQSKVNALSGQNNVLIVRYDDEDGYVAELHSISTSPTGVETISSNYYENVVLGNKLLTFEFVDNSGARVAVNEDGTNKLQMRFNSKNGKLEYCVIKASDGVEESNDNTNTPSICRIYVSFGSSQIVEIYKLTGEHHVVGSDT